MGTRRAIRTASSLVLSAILAASLGILAAAVVVPRLAGATPYTVLTGSMRPTYPPGSLVVVRPVGVDDLRPGDVITYQLRSGEPDVVTHRIVGIDVEGGELRVRTRGDANDAPDRTAVREEQIRGRPEGGLLVPSTNSVTYWATKYWTGTGEGAWPLSGSPTATRVELEPYVGRNPPFSLFAGPDSTSGRQVQWVVMEWWGGTPTPDMAVEIFLQ